MRRELVPFGRAVATASKDQPQGTDWTALGVPALGGAMGWLFGLWAGLDPAVQAYGLVSACDFIAGTSIALSQGVFDPTIARQGLMRKAFAMCIVLLIGYLQTITLTSVGIQLPAGSALALAFLGIDLMSLLRHYQRIGGDLGPLTAVLASQKKSDKEDQK